MGALILVSLCGLIIFLLSLILIYIMIFPNNTKIPRNMPILGELPDLMANFSNLMSWLTSITNQAGMTTFTVKGPWFWKLDLLVTVDPVNVKYTSSTQFDNFPRGPKSKERFDLFGDGSLFNSDANQWAAHRKINRAFFSHNQFNKFSNGLVLDKVKDITVVFDHVADGRCLRDGGKGLVDLEDLFSRYTYDLTHNLVAGSDPKTLSLLWSHVPFTKAMNIAMQSVWMRHFLPELIWKLQRLIGIGHEKALNNAKHFLNKFATTIVLAKHDKINSQCSEIKYENFKDMLSTYLMEDEYYNSGDGDEVLRGSFLSLMLAGKDTTSAALTWFFWALSQHPYVKDKIREEIMEVIPKEDRNKSHVFTLEEISKLVYLHAAVCETLRLHPPVPFQTRASCEPDTLPSGHKVSPNSTMIIIPLYIMARVESIWGKDCADFKPERWIAEGGGFKHEPSYKFFTFNSGPRICLGKELALTQIKAAIASILHNYDVHVFTQNVVPVYSVVLRTKYGLQARISKRFA